jgi:hypothetical protein
VGGLLLGCKRAAHQRGKRVVFGGLFRTARGQSGNGASGRCGLVYRLQEGSFKCGGARGRQQRGLPAARGQSGNGASGRQKPWFIGCKRAALFWRKRASEP